MNNDNTVKFNRLALLLIVLFIIGLSATFWARIYQIYWPSFQSDALTLQLKLFSTVFCFFQVILFVGSATWLFIESKKTNNNPWVSWFVLRCCGNHSVVLVSDS